ncbi:hypothetical protein ACLKA7_011910 [Drosophila subpalustris]
MSHSCAPAQESISMSRCLAKDRHGTIHYTPTPYLPSLFSLDLSLPPPQDLDRVLDRVVRCAFASDDRRSLDTRIMIGIGSVIVIDCDIVVVVVVVINRATLNGKLY